MMWTRDSFNGDGGERELQKNKNTVSIQFLDIQTFAA